MAMADITVRGAGIFGLSIAWACAQRGAKVQVVDPYGAGAGSSGGLVGALAPHVPENWNAKKAFQLDSLLMSRAFWAEVEAAGGVSPGYGRTGRLQPLNDDKALALAKTREDSAKALWQDHAIWQVRPASDFGDWCPPSATGFVVHDTLSGRMHPRRACAALVAALASKGVQVVAEAPDQGQVLHAKGYAGMLELNAAFPSETGRMVGNGVKGQAALLRFDARDLPQLYADALHLIPHADGTLAIGSTTERDFDSPDQPDGQIDDVIARALRAVPQLEGAEVIERWAGVRPRARTRAPMLGAWPGRSGHFIANGGFKIGFGMAPKVAGVMADLLLEGRDQIPEGFRVEDNL
ncbi:Glycine oxidase [Tritonibacter multivorans]|uniref:Glycine oxidase n=1 Tax=Tritonibacter multivorans TaxID=928856 RepID=A0A0P1G443_9RHOB|nr:FAD-binding oxidoreductase [Tritonibacter multivorans]MDA7422604.1 FAD-binding oxidoreductase [Tritonibacter multivorans]CUH76459.1 Glycine oxidase [Tritonibacter multivorans]SFD37605.1 Glycine/D-amino acid oxidase [Tritonibacter multivorans]